MRVRPGLVVVAALVALVAPEAEARYVRVEIENVPLARLIANLETAIAARPRDAALQHQLARVLAMGWARSLDDEAPVETVQRQPGAVEPWFGYEPAALPFASSARDAAPAGAPAAAALLERAIAAYQRALELAPDDLRIRLGLAWCQEQAGDHEAARSGYRGAIQRSWAAERDAGGRLGGWLTSEAIGYLLPLLDPARDAGEIADLEQKRRELESRPRAVTPIAIPLGDGLGPAQLLAAGARVRFDLDASGRPLAWQWITPQAAWLVWDPSGTGQIHSALQLFGSRSFQLFPADGYAALSLLDDDGDGVLRGRELDGLALWADHDGNGVSGPGEVRPLAAWGVRGLSCRAQTHASGIRYAPGGVELEGGRRRDSFDLVLHRAPAVGAAR